MWIGILATGLLVRGAFLVNWLRQPLTDPDAYVALARNLVNLGTFGKGNHATAYRPPLYPVMLAGCLTSDSWARGSIALFHLAMGLGTVWIVYRLAQYAGAGRFAPAAAILVAWDPILLSQSVLAMTETPATLLTAAAMLALSWASGRPSFVRGLVAGAGLGLMILCRPTFIPWAMAAVLAAPWFASRRRLALLGGLGLAAAVVVSPWVARNQWQFGRPILSTTHGGFTFLLANNPEFYRYLREGAWGSVWDAEQFNRSWAARAPADELLADRCAYDEAFETVRDNPGTFAYSCLVRMGRLWALVPHQRTRDERLATRLARYAVGLGYLAEYAAALVGLGVLWRSPKRRRPFWTHALLLACSVTLIHAFYWTDLRMRAPLVPLVAVAAAMAARRLSRRIRG